MAHCQDTQTPVEPADPIAPHETPAPLPAPGEPQVHRGRKRFVMLVVVLIAATAAIYFLPIRAWISNPDLIRAELHPLGIATYPVCALAIALLVAAGIPRLVFCGIAAAIFGFWPGLFLSQGAALVGYYGLFLFVRWGGRDVILRRWPKLKRTADAIHDQGILGVILARQIPLPGPVINLCLGLTHLQHRDFLIGSVIGVFPEAIPVALIGDSVRRESLSGTITYITIGVIAFAVLAIVVRHILRKMK